jgi:hypothetical protein
VPDNVPRKTESRFDCQHLVNIADQNMMLSQSVIFNIGAKKTHTAGDLLMATGKSDVCEVPIERFRTVKVTHESRSGLTRHAALCSRADHSDNFWGTASRQHVFSGVGTPGIHPGTETQCGRASRAVPKPA